MGRRFQEQFINKYKPVSGGVRTVPIRQEHMTEVLCVCGHAYFDRVIKIYLMPPAVSTVGSPADRLAVIERMRCRACGLQLENEKIPEAVKDFGREVACQGCGSDIYKAAYAIRRVSRFATGSTADQVVLAPAYFCCNCDLAFGAAAPKEEGLPTEGRAAEVPKV